ncbi:hypothetical protein BC830DRAFT_1102286 [Chytriomyces sp. MP71]|nr:hypothetical protein BC830DRAFT_1102286 [Chytriomyces sp. MP71]
MRSYGAQSMQNSIVSPPIQSQITSGLEGGISLAVSAGWSEQPMTPTHDDMYSPVSGNGNRSSWLRNNSYDSSHSIARTASPPYLTTLSPPKTVNIRPTTGWHSRSTVNQSLLLADNVDTDSPEHAWDEGMTITLDDLKAISPAHAVLASQVENSDPCPSFAAGNAPQDAYSTSPLSASGVYPRPGSSLTNSPGLDPRNLYIKNLPIDPIFDTEDLYALFSPFGRIVSAKVMKDEATWMSKGFGFVSYAGEEEAVSAMDALNGYVLDSNLPKGLVVCVAEPRGFRERKLMVLHGAPPGRR